jgi:hypothetical protein
MASPLAWLLSEQGAKGAKPMIDVFQDYETGMEPARERFGEHCGLQVLLSPDTRPEFLEMFLLYFLATGSRMTEPVEGWIRRAGERCEEIGLPETGRALKAHAKVEAGHHLMMIRDVHSLVAHWNGRRAPRLQAAEFLAHRHSPGAERYCAVHENNIVGNTPFAQVAIEYEIEMLPLRYGNALIQRCAETLGGDIVHCLNFLTEHVELDVGHTKFNARELKNQRNPVWIPAMITAGSSALNAYAEFLDDCLTLTNDRMA